MKKILVLGGGPGGVAAAIRASQLGAEVTLVESTHVGGVCMNQGCIPLRVLGSTAEAAATINRAADLGLNAGQAELNIDQLKARLADAVNYMRMGTEGLLQSNRIRIVRGQGRLLPSGEVKVGKESLSAEAVILATGAGWKRPDIPGADLKEVVTSDELLADLKIPKRLVVLGGWPWSIELAAFYHRFGAQVTLAAPGGFLPEVDRQISNRLRSLLKGEGLGLLVQAELTGIKKVKTGLEVSLTLKGKEERIVTDKVLITERVPRLKGLGLKEAGVKVAGGAVKVSSQLQTDNPRVFALGDLIGEPLLSQKASAQGVVAAENALGAKKAFDSSAIPRVLYTIPEVAAVGLTEKEAKAQGHEVVVGEIPYGVNARAMAELSADGFVKIICGARYGEVLGVHVLGPQSAELITQAALAIQLEATARELAQVVAPHPSFAEALVDAARMALGQALYVPKQSG